MMMFCDSCSSELSKLAIFASFDNLIHIFATCQTTQTERNT